MHRPGNLIALAIGMILWSTRVFADSGLLNASYDEIVATLGQASSHDSGIVAGIKYDRYHFEQRGWKTAALFLNGKTQKLETEKSDGKPITAAEKKAIFDAYDLSETKENSEIHGWRELAENHFIRRDGRVHIIQHGAAMIIFRDDLPRDFW